MKGAAKAFALKETGLRARGTPNLGRRNRRNARKFQTSQPQRICARASAQIHPNSSDAPVRLLFR